MTHTPVSSPPTPDRGYDRRRQVCGNIGPSELCPHRRTVALYAQRRAGGKRSWRVEGRRCVACGAVLPHTNVDKKEVEN
jgi:hypothetical protein